MKITGPLLLTALAVAAPLAAQNGVADRVKKVMGGKYQAPVCNLKKGDFRVSSAGTYLFSAGDAGDPVSSEYGSAFNYSGGGLSSTSPTTPTATSNVNSLRRWRGNDARTSHRD